MRIATIIIRVLLGLLFIFSSAVVLLGLAPQPELQGNVKVFNEGLAASGYLLGLIKVTELVCGIAFVSGFFVPLATVVIFPIALNILLFHAVLAPAGLPTAIFVFGANLFLAYACRQHYRALFSAKIRKPEPVTNP